jgi:Flp pilus assembly protein TadB
LIVASSLLPPYESPVTDFKILAWLLIALPILVFLYLTVASAVVRGILKSIFTDPKRDTLLTIE